jgi:mycothiol synthase
VSELTTRPYAAGDEFAIAELHNRVEQATGGVPNWIAGRTRAVIELQARDIARDTALGFAPDGELITYGIVRLPVLDGGRVIVDGAVHPDWWGRGLGASLLDRQLARAAAMVTDGYADVRTAQDNVRGLRLFARSGFVPVRYEFAMARATSGGPAAPMPDGIRVVAFSEERTEELYAAHTEAFADLWEYQSPGFDDWVRMAVGSNEFRWDLSRIAYAYEQIAGYVLAYSAGDDEVHFGQIGTRRPWRRRGVAAALIASSLVECAEVGKVTARLVVDADSPTGAAGVYERMGFAATSRTVSLRRPLRAPLS